MPTNDNGKVIVSLIAGATAGVVAGLLLAPETGEDTRKTLAEGASKIWGGSLGQLVQGAIARITGQPAPAADNSAHPDQQAADAALQNLNNPEPGDLATPAGAGNGRSVEGNEDVELDSYRAVK